MGDDGLRWSVSVQLSMEAINNPDLAPLMRERDRYFRAQVSDDVTAGIAAGSIRPDVDPEAVAVAAVGQLRGISLQRLLDPTAVNLVSVRKHLLDHWRRALSTK
jgi:hypothetical protein